MFVSGPTKLKVIVVLSIKAAVVSLFKVIIVVVADTTEVSAGIPAPVTILPTSGVPVAFCILILVPAVIIPKSGSLSAVIIFKSKSALAPELTL